MAEYKWGDDPGRAIEKAAGTPLAQQIEGDVVAGYLILLRTLLEKESDLAAAVSSDAELTEAKERLVAAVKLKQLMKPGTERMLDKAATDLLAELHEQRRQPPSLYLVSCRTGRAVQPMGARDVYTPPDYRGLDGEMHRSNPIVHPGISSTLALASHEAAKEEAMLALAGADTSLAYAHMSAPEQMVERAKQKLHGRVTFGESSGPWQDVEFGREHVAGMEQAPNFSFHRVEMFSAVLARRILNICGDGGRCGSGSIRSCRGAKHRWYVFTARFERSDASSLSQ